MRELRIPRTGSLVAAILATCVSFCAAPCFAHTPESPEVKRMVEKGAEFLRTAVLRGAPPVNYNVGGGVPGVVDVHNNSLGALMLAGMVCYKLSGVETDPVVELAVTRTRTAINGNGLNFNTEGAYECAIAIIFLSEVENGKYRDDVKKALTFLIRNQQKCGAWMYNASSGDGAGDTSVTQYAILALWSAKNIGLTIPSDVTARACNWLVHSQHVSGQFSYLPPMPSGTGRSQQGVQLKSSMTIAGVGSLYICADIMRMNLAKNKALENEDGLPTAFRLVNPPSLQGPSFDESLRSLQKEVELGIVDGEKVLAAQFPFADQQYLYYTYYSYERVQSLKDALTKRKPPAEPEWYNRFVDIARDTQNPDGSWVKGTGRVCDTAFMCLTLMRSMQNVIKKLKNTEGTLVGGRGLPGDTSNVAVKRGKIVSTEQANSKEDILKVLEGSDAAALDDILEQANGSLLDSTPENRAAQLASLQKTLIEGNFSDRRKAIKVLATDDNLENAPLLIFALSDPDMDVVRGAEAGLRRVSRRLVSVEIPENATKEEKEKRIDTWKTWYKNLRPDAIFLR